VAASLEAAIAIWHKLTAASQHAASGEIHPRVLVALASGGEVDAVASAVRLVLEEEGLDEGAVIVSLKSQSLRALSAVPLKALDSPERIALHRSCQGALVCSVLEYGVKPELDLLARFGKLPQWLADKVGDAAVKAGRHCRVNTAYNSAGKSVRKVFEQDCGVSLAELRQVIEVMAANQPDDALSKAPWSLYLFWSSVSRNTLTPFGKGLAEGKAGATSWLDRTGEARVTNTDATAARYGAQMYEFMPSNIVAQAVPATRGLRDLSEIEWCWQAAVCGEGLATPLTPSSETGEEGLLGPQTAAPAWLQQMAQKVRSGEAMLPAVFTTARLRKSGHGKDAVWEKLR